MMPSSNQVGEVLARVEGATDGRFAPPGAIWVCAACGKTSTDSYGIEGDHSPGWDESCMLNAVLCHDRQHVNSLGLISWFGFNEPLPSYALRALPNQETDRGNG